MDTNHSAIKRSKGQHLDAIERGMSQTLHEEGYSNRQVAKRSGVSPTTACHELRRGTPERKSSRGRKPQDKAARAPKKADERSRQKRGSSGLGECREFLAWLKIQAEENDGSFDVLVNLAKIRNLFPGEVIPCVKTLYNWLHSGGLNIDVFKTPETLRRKPGNTPRTAGSRTENKTSPGRSIDDRPEDAQTRTEFGRWDIDSVIGLKSGRGCALMTILGKMTHKLNALKLPGKTSQAMAQAIKAF